MERKRVDFKALDPGIHPAALRFEESAVDSSHSPIPDDLRFATFVTLYPPTFATFKDQCWLVANHLSLLILLRILKVTKFQANFCSPEECSNDHDVKYFAQCDRLLYQGIIDRPLKTKRASRTYSAQKKRIHAGQVCPICPSRSTPQPLTARKHGAGLVKRGEGGPVTCKSCGFRVALSVTQLKAFLRYELSTTDLIETKKDLQGNQVPCPLCVNEGRSGVLLVWKTVTRADMLRVSCSLSQEFHTTPDCHSSKGESAREAA